MATGFVKVIKRAALEAVANSKPADLRYGTVISTSPLKVQITQRFILPEAVLIVPEHLTEHEIEVSITSGYGWDTENKSGGSGDSAFASHNHDIVISKKKMMVHNQLKVGDKVALLRQQGGQLYFILDRIK